MVWMADNRVLSYHKKTFKNTSQNQLSSWVCLRPFPLLVSKQLGEIGRLQTSLTSRVMIPECRSVTIILSPAKKGCSRLGQGQTHSLN